MVCVFLGKMQDHETIAMTGPRHPVPADFCVVFWAPFFRHSLLHICTEWVEVYCFGVVELNHKGGDERNRVKNKSPRRVG